MKIKFSQRREKKNFFYPFIIFFASLFNFFFVIDCISIIYVAYIMSDFHLYMFVQFFFDRIINFMELINNIQF